MRILDTVKKMVFGVSDSEALFSVRGFSAPNDNIREHLEEVGRQFLHGYHLALTAEHNASLRSELDACNAMYRGFAFEGAAMALMLLDSINPLRKSLPSFIANEAAHHIYMLHVGAGWALARLPLNLERSLQHFHPVYRWLVVDGYGFHQAYFKTEKFVMQAAVPKRLSGYSLHAFYQGIGRAIWFVSGAEVEKAMSLLSNFPQAYHADLWSGIGLACTYAGGQDKAAIESLAERSGPYRLHLGQGAVFAATARYRAGNMVPHTELATAVLAGTGFRNASDIADNTLKTIPSDAESGLPAYEVWRQRIRDELHQLLFNDTTKPIVNENVFS